MIIDRLPQCLQPFFQPLRRLLSKPQFGNLWALVTAWTLNLRKAKLTHLAALLAGRHRTARGDFLNHSDWDAADLLDRQAWALLLRRLRARPGDTIELLIDDVRIAKRGRKMAGLSKIWDHKGQRFVRGHLVVTGAIRYRGVVLPWRFAVWQPKALAGRRYRKTTEIAAGLIRDFPAPRGLKVRVLFDAFYLSPVVVRACEAQGFTWFSVAARNRAAQPDGGQRRKLADLAPGWLRHHGRNVRMRRARGWRRLRIAALDGHLSRIGRVRLVIAKRPREPWKNLVVFATNETELEARAIVAEYEKRWAIEVLFKELRGSLGLGDYQVLNERGIRNHLHLCGLAHLLLTHHSLGAVGAQAKKGTKDVPLPPLSQRLEALRDAVRRERMERVVRRTRHASSRRRLKKLLQEFAQVA
jgi:SRSO17 transposase